jgi:hypothetical protein
MATKSVSRDRARVSSQKHELSYAGKNVRGGAAAIREAKEGLGRSTSRSKVMAKARGE